MEITDKQKSFLLELAKNKGIELDIENIIDSKTADLKIKELMNGSSEKSGSEKPKNNVNGITFGMANKLVYQDWSRKYKRPLEHQDAFRNEVLETCSLFTE